MKLKYLAYNILKTDYTKLNQYLNQLVSKRKISKTNIVKNIFQCFFQYNTSFLDYFYFRFFNDNTDKEIHTNVWDMHLFHKYCNKKNAIILRNKLLFRDRFKKYFNYPYFELQEDAQIAGLIVWIKENAKNKIVAKVPCGTVGKGVRILSISYKNENMCINGEPAEEVINNLLSKGYKLYETFIEQHPVLKNIHPTSINTIRIVTFVNEHREVEIWGALLRMGNNKPIDNFDAGGLSASIDLENGIVITPAIIKDPFCPIEFIRHPITDIPILGEQIPFWKDVIEMIISASLELEDVRTVGWDVAITVNGPTLIEGNDNWDKTHFELVSRTGLNYKIKTLLRKR